MQILKAGVYSGLFWNSEQLGRYIVSPNVSLRYRITGRLDTARLAQALQRTVLATPLLNWHLHELDGALYWRQNPQLAPLEVHDDTTHEASFELTRFDLAAGPLYRPALFTVGRHAYHLALLFHHAVFEARSVPWFVSRLSAAYAEQPVAPCATPDVIAATFSAQWQRMQTLEQHGAGDFWRTALRDAPAENVLPLDTARAPAWGDEAQSAHAFVVKRQRWEERSPSLRRCTLFSVLMATWGALVARYGNQEYVQIVYPVAMGARGPECFGSAINSLVQVYRLQHSTSLLDLCHGYAEHVRAMKQGTGGRYSEWPTERLLAGSAVRRLNVGFAMVGSRDPILLEGCAVAPLPCREQDMGEGQAWLLCAEQGDDLRLQLLYRPSCMDAAQARQLATQYVALLDWVLQHPHAPLARFSLCAPPAATERPAGVRRGAGATLLSGFELQARQRPQQTALRCGDAALSYGELDARARLLALALHEQHLQIHGRPMPQETLVGLCVQDRMSMLVGMLAILKAGAAYVPVDPAYPAQRRQFMLGHARPALLLSDACGAEGAGVPTVALDTLPVHSGHPLPPVRAGQLAYVIYTSGSTGTPKGVMVSHGAAVNAVQAKMANDGLDGDATACLMLSCAFDASVAVIFSALHAGAVLCLPQRRPVCARELNQMGVTHLTCPAALAEWLCQVELPAVRQLNLGGDAVAGRLLARLAQRHARVSLEYGITEAGIISTIESRAQADAPFSVGLPLPNTTAHVLDRFGQLLPAGATGELYLGGRGLARGYLHDPVRTAERFVCAPYHDGRREHGGERLYRTGDLARQRSDGRIEFLGRGDSQVKLRGYRIELQEIVLALQGVPGVGQAHACLQQTAAGGRLIGYYTAAPAVAPPSVLAALQAVLPAHAVPQQLLRMDAFPLGANGKLDLGQLPVPALQAAGIAAPRDEVEMALLAIWQSLFSDAVFGIDTSFHDLGGNSLQALRLAREIETRLGCTLALEQVLRRPTIAGLAACIREGGGDAAARGSGNVFAFRDGAAANIICVHPAGGTAFCYATLAQYSQTGTGVHGIQAQGIRAGEAPLPDVQAMAAHYLPQIRHLTDRPHVLAGWSLGGYVALEMACQLRAEGNRNLTLVLFDTQTPCFDEAVVAPTSREAFVEKLVRFNGMHSGVGEDDIDRFHHLYNHNVLSMQNYQASRFEGPALFIGTGGASAVQAGAWRAWLPQLRVAHVGGDHWTLMDPPHVQAVAGLVQACLSPAPR